MSLSDKAIVVGYDGFGNVSYLTELLHRYGFGQIYALVNDGSKLQRSLHSNSPTIVEVPNILNASALARAVESVVGTAEVPFLCLQDRPMFSYLAARQLLYGPGPHIYHVPSDGIIRARIKPAARVCWKRGAVENTRWTILGDSSVRNQHWRLLGGLNLVEGVKYVVKPICGMASEMVTVAASLARVAEAAEEIRAYFETPQFRFSTDRELVVDGEEYQLYRDVLVEELLEGCEFTLDGYSSTSDVSVVAQHKETVWRSSFIGDGSIFAPPDHLPSDPHADEPPLYFTGLPTTSNDQFADFGRRALTAIGLSNWGFHGEIVVTRDTSIHFVELNPRSPGGLLWRTAGLHLGIDPVEAIVRCHLRIPNYPRKIGWVTVQFPIYAATTGIVDQIHGVDEARKLPYVELVQVVKAPGDLIENDHQENYAAFVCIQAPNHYLARQTEKAARAVLHVKYRQ